MPGWWFGLWFELGLLGLGLGGCVTEVGGLLFLCGFVGGCCLVGT